MNFLVLGDDVLAPMLTTPEEDWAIAHELAHQWWGNRRGGERT
jgi:aminopeptidase N